MAKLETKRTGTGRRSGTPCERPRERTHAWLREHAAEYPGCWIALADDQLIAADADLEIVLQAVERAQSPVRPIVWFEPKPVE